MLYFIILCYIVLMQCFVLYFTALHCIVSCRVVSHTGTESYIAMLYCAVMKYNDF